MLQKPWPVACPTFMKMSHGAKVKDTSLLSHTGTASFVDTIQVLCSNVFNLFEVMLFNGAGDCAFRK